MSDWQNKQPSHFLNLLYAKGCPFEQPLFFYSFLSPQLHATVTEGFSPSNVLLHLDDPDIFQAIVRLGHHHICNHCHILRL